MEAPDFNRVVETFIRICPKSEPHDWKHLDLMRNVVAPLIRDLRSDGLVGWFAFLVHDTSNGVPPELGTDDVYWHVRLELRPGVELDVLSSALLPECEGTRVAELAPLQQVSFPERSLLEAGAHDVWRLLGDQSEWFMSALDAFRDVPADKLLPGLNEFLHYFANMAQLEARLS